MRGWSEGICIMCDVTLQRVAVDPGAGPAVPNPVSRQQTIVNETIRHFVAMRVRAGKQCARCWMEPAFCLCNGVVELPGVNPAAVQLRLLFHYREVSGYGVRMAPLHGSPLLLSIGWDVPSPSPSPSP